MSLVPDFNNHTWVESDLAQEYCLEHPGDAGCADVDSRYEYRLNLAANVAFLAIFSISLVGFIFMYALKRLGTGFTIALSLGCICEILGYMGRTMSYYNQWEELGFFIQICCLTFGPAFLAAGCYLCLRRIVLAVGKENSRVPPHFYTRIFIPCDLVALVLQAMGGGMAASADDPKLGTDIMIAGLSFQVATGAGFIIASADFALRTYRRYKALGEQALDQSPEFVAMRRSPLFRAFVPALGFASFCILVRSTFRVAELSEGWSGPIMARQDLFIAFEGVLIVLTCVVLNVFHPAICMPAALMVSAEHKGLSFLKKKKTEKNMMEFKSRSGSESD